MKHLEFISSVKKGSLIINILISLSLLIFVFGQIGRFTPFEIPAYGNVYEVFLFVATIFLILRVKFSEVVKNTLLLHSIQVFVVWLGISLIISLFQYGLVQNILAILYFVRLFFYFTFLLYFLTYIKKNPHVTLYFNNIVQLAAGMIVVLSLIQYFLYPDIGNIAYAGWDPHLYRLVGLYLDPPLTAAIFILCSGYFIFSSQRKVITFLTVGTFGILFFLTYSRGGFMAILATITVFSLRNMKFTYLVGFILGTILLLVIIPKNLSEGLNLTRTTSIKTRLADYSKAIQIWQKSPLIGIGYNHIRAEKDSYEREVITEKYNPSHSSASFHSSFLMILVTGGAIGLLLYFLVLARIMQLSSFAFYSTIFLSVYSLTDNLLLHPFILFLWFFLIGLTHLSRSE